MSDDEFQEKKNQQDRAREEAIRQQEIENLKGPRHIEGQRLKQKLRDRGLALVEV